MSGSLSIVGGFWARFPLKKLGRQFVFLFFVNKNSGKAFAVPSKKTMDMMNRSLFSQSCVPIYMHEM
jgi:hypothetical protein